VVAKAALAAKQSAAHEKQPKQNAVRGRGKPERGELYSKKKRKGQLNGSRDPKDRKVSRG